MTTRRDATRRMEEENLNDGVPPQDPQSPQEPKMPQAPIDVGVMSP